MKILVTGSEGQVGSAIIQQASTHKYNHITLISCNKSQCDITNINSIYDAIAEYNPDIIINTAAYTAVDKAQSEPERAFLVNATGPENLAKICAEKNIFLMHLSTDYVFDGTKKTGYLETDVPNPINVYGQSKYQGEQAIRQYCEHYLILRVSWVFFEKGHNFVNTLLRLAQEKNELNIVCDQYGGPTYAGDIAHVLLKIAENRKTGLYHYSGAPKTSWFEFAKIILKNKHIKINPIKTKNYPTPAKRPLNGMLNCDLIQTEWGITLSPWEQRLWQNG